MHCLSISLTENYDEYPIILKLYDEDVVSDEFIGSAVINVKDVIK